jgi:aldose 1-epimerase
MKSLYLPVLSLLPSLLSAQSPGVTYTGVAGNTTIAGSSLGPDSNGKYHIYGPGIHATFIPYGASISNLFINDTSGIERDIVAGYDNASYYTADKVHPHFGGVPGRYANRIKNSSFVIDGEEYKVLPNENPTKDNPQGIDTLHGGPDGWDWRNWTVVAHTGSSITFSLTGKL